MKINITKDTAVKNFNHHWKFCVGADHAAYALRHDYISQLKEVHKDLGIERVRFHGIFDDDMHTIHRATDILPIPFGWDYKETSFRQCGVAYDNVLSAGMKPYVELSFMPKQMAMFPMVKGSFFYRPNISMPAHRRHWHNYIKSFVEFLIDRYGRKEVESWYFEVWNEPDLFAVFSISTQLSFFQIYAATVTAIKEVDSNIKVGGPVTSGSKWISEFLTYCSNNDVPVDFISTHQYAGDPIGGISQDKQGLPVKIDILTAVKDKKKLAKNNIIDLYRSFMSTKDATDKLNPESLIKSAENVKAISRDLPVYYTEWNMCASFSAEVNDTSMQAAYDVHSILNTQDTIAGSSIWCFSDIFEEFHQFPEEFHGGFGMMTQSSIKKPTYRALQFLNDAGNKAYDVKGNSKIDCAVFKKKNEIHVILSMLDIKGRKSPESVDFTIESDSAPISSVINKIDESHCNPLKNWKNIGSPQTPNPSQVAEIKKASAPVDEDIDVSFENGVISFSSTIGSNEIQRIIIKLETEKQ